jgi:hypothetical protein
MFTSSNIEIQAEMTNQSKNLRQNVRSKAATATKLI